MCWAAVQPTFKIFFVGIVKHRFCSSNVSRVSLVVTLISKGEVSVSIAIIMRNWKESVIVSCLT